MNQRAMSLLAAFTLVAFRRSSAQSAPSSPPDPRNIQEYVAFVRTCERPAVASQILGCVLPEFGGAFRDSTGVLNVWLTDLEASPRATRIVQYELQRVGRSELSFRFRKGEFSFQEFNRYQRQLLPYLGPPGIAAWGIDEWTNRLRIVYVTEDVHQRLEAAIKKLGIPRASVQLEKGDYVRVL
jgi:hypothetical protein